MKALFAVTAFLRPVAYASVALFGALLLGSAVGVAPRSPTVGSVIFGCFMFQNAWIAVHAYSGWSLERRRRAAETDEEWERDR